MAHGMGTNGYENYLVRSRMMRFEFDISFFQVLGVDGSWDIGLNNWNNHPIRKKMMIRSSPLGPSVNAEYLYTGLPFLWQVMVNVYVDNQFKLSCLGRVKTETVKLGAKKGNTIQLQYNVGGGRDLTYPVARSSPLG